MLMLGETQRQSRPHLRLFAFSLVVLACACNSLSVSISDTNPPVFTFSAGPLAECCDHLAFFVVSEVADGQDDERVIWKIQPKSGADNSANGLPPITYGTVPEGFEQVIPSSGTAPVLQEGKLYEASGPRVEVPDAFARFRIKNGKAVRMRE